MKKQLLVVLSATAFFAVGNAFGQAVSNLDGLHYWGTGSNRSALVVDWNDGKTNEVLAWGFRWSGAAPTIFDMMSSIAATDPRFFLRIDSATNLGGPAVFGIGYQTGSSPFGVTGAQNALGGSVTPVFTAGISDINTNGNATETPTSSAYTAPLNAADHYKEAWNDNGFWTSYFAGSDHNATAPGADYPTTWTDAWVGVGGANLVDNGWYALSISEPSYANNLPGSAVAAVPEPGSFALLLFAAGVVFVITRRRRSRAA